MDAEQEEYVLGEEVTSAAVATSRQGTAVLSVRLPADEIGAIENISRAAGKTPSQVVREALRAYLHVQRHAQAAITVSIQGGYTVSTGYQGQTSLPATAETRDTRIPVLK